jgi:hypothetical protein
MFHGSFAKTTSQRSLRAPIGDFFARLIAGVNPHYAKCPEAHAREPAKPENTRAALVRGRPV